MYKTIFKKVKYPNLLNTIDDLKLSGLPPWEFIIEDYLFWKNQFDEVSLLEHAPFARMRNDDVIASFNIYNGKDEIYLFNLPLFKNTVPKPFIIYTDINLWLKRVLDDSYEYLVDYS